MPTSTYDLLASTIVTSSTASVTFSSIPSTYRHLVLVMNTTTSDSGGEHSGVYFNGAITSGQGSSVFMQGDGSTAGQSTTSRISHWTRTGPVLTIMQIFDYSATDKQKPVLTRSNDAGSRTIAYSSIWPSTAAVNSIKILDSYWDSATFQTGTFHLYGIVS